MPTSAMPSSRSSPRVTPSQVLISAITGNPLTGCLVCGMSSLERAGLDIPYLTDNYQTDGYVGYL